MEQRNHDAVLVTLADRNFIDQAKQLFSSVYWNAGWKGDYMLLAHEIPEKDLKWFRDKGILVKKCKPLWGEFIGNGYSKHPSVVLDKFYLFTPEFKKWKNIIFLDADIIVRGSIERLAQVKGFWAGAAVFNLSHQFSENNKKLYEEIKNNYNLNSPSFNSGVLVFSTDIITIDLFKRAIFLFKRYKEIVAVSEESIFNLLFYKNRKKLSWIYETDVIGMVSHYMVNPKRLKGMVLHFIIYPPWVKENPFYNEWKMNLDKAGLINLRNRPKGKNWPIIKIYFYSSYIIFYKIRTLITKFREEIIKVKNELKSIIINTFNRIKNIIYNIKSFFIYILLPKTKEFPNKILGIIGQTIKKISPQLYYKLKGKNGTKKS